MKFSKILFLNCLIALTLQALAPRLNAGTDTESVTLGLNAVAERVRRHNPELTAARLRIEEALGRLDQAGRLSNPELGTQYQRTRHSGEHAFEVEFAQSFPLTARLRLEKDVSRAALAIAETEVREVERNLIGQARHAAVRYAANRQLIGLQREQQKIANELAAFIDKVVARAEGSAIDAGQARLESTRVSLKIHELESDAKAILGELRPLLGLEPGAGLAITGSLPAPRLPRNAPVDPAFRPDYRAALIAVNGAEHEIALEKARRVEDIKVGIVGERAREEDAPGGLENESTIGLRVSIPLPLWNKNRGGIREKQAKKKRVEAEAAALSNRIRNEAAAAVIQMRAHAEHIREYDSELMPLLERQLKLTDEAYRNGRADLQSVLRARDQKIDLESARLEELRDFHLARVRFETAAGLTDIQK